VICLDKVAALHERMAQDGYLLLRGLIDRGKVLKARKTVLKFLEEHNALVPDTPLLEGVMGRSPKMMGRKGIQHHPDVLAVLEGDELFRFFERFFSAPAITFKYKWLRAVGNEEYTGAHMDFVYMGRGSGNLHTTWIPLGDIPMEQGTLVMCAGSHRLDSFARIRETYGTMDVDRDRIEGWFSKDPLEISEKCGGNWVSGDFRAGDVMIFGMHTMHASTTNLTNRFRLSCDVRFQPASDPMDERWKADGVGHTASVSALKSMTEARAEWGV
jgi:hypothetical protein